MPASKVFSPAIIETKQELLHALRRGELQCSKYNTLTEEQQMFVELIAFGNYTGEQAIKVLRPSVLHGDVIANRLMANPNVAEVLEELTVTRDKKFMSEAVNARDAALRKLNYIMHHSQDQSLQLAAAKTILEKTNDYMKIKKKQEEEEGVGRVVFQIKTMNVNPAAPIVRSYDDIIADAVTVVENAGEEFVMNTVTDQPIDSEKVIPAAEVPPEPQLSRKERKSTQPYVLVYEGVDNYSKEDSNGESRTETQNDQTQED